MNEIKKKIIEGIKLLNEECKQIPQENIIWVGVAGGMSGAWIERRTNEE